MRWWPLGLFFATGCSGELLIERPPPWAADAQLALMIVDELGRTVGPPSLFRAGAKVEVVIPVGGAREVVVYEYAADAVAPDGSPLVDCGAVYEGPWYALEAPIHQYRSGVIDRSDDTAFALTPSDAALIPLFHPRCIVSVCDELDVDRVVIPFGNELLVSAAIGGEDAYVVGTVANSGDPARIAIVKVIDRVPIPIAGSDLLRGKPNRLVFDGARTFYGAANPVDRPGGNLFAFDLDGTPRPVPVLALGPGGSRVAIGDDGALFAGGAAGLYEIVKGSTVAVRVDAVTEPVGQLAVWSRDRILVVDEAPAIHFYDGVEWMTEWIGTTSMTISDAAIDPNQAVVVGGFGTILRRDEARRSWVPMILPPDESTASISAVTLLQGDRIAVAFNRGGMAFWNGGAWCTELAPIDDGNILSLTTSPNGLRGFGVTAVRPVLGPELHIIAAKRR